MVLPLETFSSQELPPVNSSSQLCTVGLAAVQGLPQLSAKCLLLVAYHVHSPELVCWSGGIMQNILTRYS